MSHRQKISGDPAGAQEIVLRKSRNAVIIFDFINADGSDYPVSDDFVLRIKQDSRSEDNLLELSIGDGLEFVDDNIHANFTEENSTIDQYKCVYELINLTSGQTWIASKIYFNTGEPIENTTSEVTSTINLGDQIIQCSITIAAGLDIDGGGFDSVYSPGQSVDGGEL
jgi:hypothetical protein